MGLFDQDLQEGESIFLETMALDVDFVPPVIEGREAEQEHLAGCIKPILIGRAGKQLVLTGSPGIGKTVAARYVLQELEKEHDGIYCLYINCWKKNTSHKIILDFCDNVGLKFTFGRDTSELLGDVAKIINKKAAVIVLDEVDKLESADILYTLMEDLFKKSLILITNNREWYSLLDSRIRSRLMAEMREFAPYSKEEIAAILKRRVEFAFVPGVFQADALSMVVEKAHRSGDLRVGLFLLKEAGEMAEKRASRKVEVRDVKNALEKLPSFTINKEGGLDEEERFILGIVKEQSGKTLAELYPMYQQKGGTQSYSNFSRNIKNLAAGKFVTTKILNKPSGRSMIVSLPETALSEFS